MPVLSNPNPPKQILVNLTEDRRTSFLLPEDWSRLHALGEIVFHDPKSEADARCLPDQIACADAMLTTWGSRPLLSETFPDRKRPFLVSHGAGSIRKLIPRELLTRGVVLSHAPAGVAPAVAQYAVGLMICALRQVTARAAALRTREKFVTAHGGYRDLEELTVGIVGLSQVGRRVPPLLAPFNCRVIAYDPYWKAEDAALLGVTLVDDLDALIAQSDVVTLHAPVTQETENLIDARRVGLIRPGSVFINTARGTLVDHEALFARAIAGEIEAYLDVTHPEPIPPDHPAWTSPHILITPHIAGPTRQSMRRVVRHAIDEIERYFAGVPLLTPVTPERYDILA